MRLSDWVKTMKTTTDKDDVVKAIQNTINELNNRTIPAVNTAAAVTKTFKFKTADAIELDSKYKEALHLGRNANLFADLQERFKLIMTNVVFLQDTAETTLPQFVTRDQIDQRTATLLQLIEYTSWMSRYTRKLTETLVIFETEGLNIYEDYQKNNINKGEMAWVKKKMGDFLNLITILAVPDKDFKKLYESIPLIKVDTDSDIINSIVSKLKMDPFKMGFIPVRLNPFFHIGKWIVEYQANRHKEAQEDYVRIQKRILLLEEGMAGKSNPKIEKELEILRDKSESLVYRINKTEEEINQ